ncbi:hypothetical protein [Embleya sp. NPDC059237]|uniref:hypothetical protein n=1 Tax=Embleya sp. NPDC059237 TaxID=3346784 RepID=UPI0036B0DACA
MNSTAMRVIRWFLGAVASVLLLLLGVVAWGVSSCTQNTKTPHAPDVDRVAGAPEVGAAQRTAVRDVEAAYTALEQSLGGRAERRGEAVSDVCGAMLKRPSFFGEGGGRWSKVRCEREIVRAYVLDGPRATHATIVADALTAAGWSRPGADFVDPGTSPCPAPAPSTPRTPSTQVVHEYACIIEATLPSRVSLHAQFSDQDPLPYFSSRLRPTDARSTTGTITDFDVHSVTNTPRAAGSSVVIVSVLDPYFQQ